MRLLSALLIACAAIGALPQPARSGAIAGVDAMMSTVMQENQSSFSGLGMRMKLRSTRLAEGIDFLPSIEYWRNHTMVQEFGIEASRRDATLAIDARYSMKHEGWTPYGGLGFGVHFLSENVDAPTLGLYDRHESLVKGAWSALAGVGFPITPSVENFLELKYHHLTDYRQLKLNWGLSWNFGAGKP